MEFDNYKSEKLLNQGESFVGRQSSVLLKTTLLEKIKKSCCCFSESWMDKWKYKSPGSKYSRGEKCLFALTFI